MALSDAAKIGLWGSLGIHLLFLIGVGGIDAEGVSGKNFVRISTDSLDALVSTQTGALALGSFATAPGPNEEKLAERRRQAYMQYLEDVSLEIHSHRLDFGHTDLIGIVTYSFLINSDGRFEDIRLRISSGHPQLDEVAKRAIEVSSGKVKRPKILGTHRIGVVQEVRFQYGLR